MTSARNGFTNGYAGHGTARRFRIDGNRPTPPSGPAHSGRKFVIAAALGVLAVWGILGLVFRDWRIQHEKLATFGAHDVAPLVEPLKARRPPGMDEAAWNDAVESTRDMLLRLTSSGLFDRQSILQLRDEVKLRVESATSDTAHSTLARLWDDLEHKAGPVLLRKNRNLRPRMLGPSDPSLTSGRVWAG